MKEVVVSVKDKPGELSRLAEILGDSNVNIKTISTDRNKKGERIVRIVPQNDAEKAARILQDKGYQVRTNPLLVISLVDRPGELAKSAKALAQVGVNIESVYVIGNENDNNGKRRTQVALHVSDFAQAEKALKPFIANI